MNSDVVNPVSTRLRREIVFFSLFIGEKRRGISLSACFLENSTQEEFAYIRRSERAGIIALKFQRTRSHFFKKSDPIVKFLPPSPSSYLKLPGVTV